MLKNGNRGLGRWCGDGTAKVIVNRQRQRAAGGLERTRRLPSVPPQQANCSPGLHLLRLRQRRTMVQQELFKETKLALFGVVGPQFGEQLSKGFETNGVGWLVVEKALECAARADVFVLAHKSEGQDAAESKGKLLFGNRRLDRCQGREVVDDNIDKLVRGRRVCRLRIRIPFFTCQHVDERFSGLCVERIVFEHAAQNIFCFVHLCHLEQMFSELFAQHRPQSSHGLKTNQATQREHHVFAGVVLQRERAKGSEGLACILMNIRRRAIALECILWAMEVIFEKKAHPQMD